jgi:hypothetical protein
MPIRVCALILATLSCVFACDLVRAQTQANTLHVYPFPPELQYSHHNDDFSVQAREPGGTWQDLYEWNVVVDHDRPQNASMVYFDFTGSVELRIQKNNGRFQNVGFGPRNGAPRATTRDGIVHFTLDKPQNLAVFFDDDRLHNLHIFAGAPLPPPKTENLRRFGQGLHRPQGEAKYFSARSGETVYLEGGAVLMGGFRLRDVDNVRIVGRGLILPPGKLSAVHSSNISFEGPIVITPDDSVGGFSAARDVSMTDVKGITGGRWTDGINIYSSERVVLDRLFMRTSDDSVTVYAHRNDIYGDARDIRVTNSILWTDIAHAMFIGIHGNTQAPETIENVLFDNIDVVSIDEDEPEYQGVMGITAGDSNLIRNVTFSNIRIDRIEDGKLFNLHVGFNAKYNTSPGRGIDNVLFRNIFYTGNGMPSASVIYGYDADRVVRDVRIENLVIAGKRAKDAESANLVIGDFVTGVRIE